MLCSFVMVITPLHKSSGMSTIPECMDPPPGKAAGMWTRLDLLRTAYAHTAEVLGGLSEADAARPSGCAGWAVLDLAQHLVFDARRGLVATATPAGGPATTDAVGYWRAWQQPPDEADDDRWRTRATASLAGGIGPLAQAFAECSAAVVVAASRSEPDDLVRTQGHVLTLDDLLSTLVVESAVHALDLVAELDRPGPAAGPLAEVRRVLDELLGRPLPAHWDDATAARRATGRAPLDERDRAELGQLTGRLPLLS